MNINYKVDFIPDVLSIIELFDNSGLRRPTSDENRIYQMFANANLIISAWDGDLLVGISRSLTDFCYCCYLSDLSVRLEYQHKGIGKKLINLTKEKIGVQTTLILLSAPQAMAYYPKIGLEKIDNGYIIKRKS